MSLPDPSSVGQPPPLPARPPKVPPRPAQAHPAPPPPSPGSGPEPDGMPAPPSSTVDAPPAPSSTLEPSVAGCSERRASSTSVQPSSSASTLRSRAGVSVVARAPPKPKVPANVWPLLAPHAPNDALASISNEHIWMLLRRFNRQAFRVRRVLTPQGGPDHAALPAAGAAPAGQLDFDSAPDMVFNPDKFRALLERAYIQVGIPSVHMARHLYRIFTWADRRRSSFFCVLYFSAWAAGHLEGTLLLLLLALIMASPLRAALFPPLPGSEPPTTSKAGAAANLMGLPIERDASRFVDAIGTMAATMVGLGPKDASTSDTQTFPGPSAPGTPVSTVSPTVGAEELAIPQVDEPAAEPHLGEGLEELAGGADPPPSPSAARQGTADTVSESNAHAHNGAGNDNLHKTIWRAAAPYLFMLVTFVDTVERFGNALSPTPPFPQWEPRLKLGGIVGGFVLFVWSGLVSPALVYHSTTFMMGAAMFGSPVLHFFFPTTTEVVVEVVDEVVDLAPGWRYDVQLRHSLLKGVPTNAQLAATLLRIAEEADKPVPPPPADPLAPAGRTGKARSKAKTQAPPPPPAPPPAPRRMPSSSESSASDRPRAATGASSSADAAPVGHKRALFKSFVKTTAQLGTETLLGAGKVKASLLGSVPSKYSLAPPPSNSHPTHAKDPRRIDGPVVYRARYADRPGLLHVLPYRDGVRAPHLRWLPEGRMAGAMGHVATFTGLNWSWADGQSSLAAGKPSSAARDSPAAAAAPTPTAAASGTSTPWPAQPGADGYVPGRGEVHVADAEGKPKLREVDVSIASVTGVRKRGGMGFSSRMMLSWMLDIETVDVLELTTPDATYRFSDVAGRDALVARILALAPHRWEFT